jgi:hypothetical protein
LFTLPTAPPEISLDGPEAAAARRFLLAESWLTDFNSNTVDLSSITNLLPRDRIKPVDDPLFAPVSAPPDYMRPREPVIAVTVNGEARAYPLAILMWQEIVNDTLGGEPVAVTFCPLCNTGVVFRRTVEGHELTFGTSGNLRNSDLVMWDRQTESWWQQITGEAIVGRLAGRRLEQLPAAIIAWETFLEQYPSGEVLLREAGEFGGFIRSYDTPPYAGYDSVGTNPFAFDGVVDDRLPANMRTLTVKAGGESAAYTWPFLAEARVVNDVVGGEEIVAFFDDGTLSAFLNVYSESYASGSTTVFSRVAGNEALTFVLDGGRIVDEQTGSAWTIAGKAVEGPLAGSQLEPVVHQNHFWFAWAVFEPDTVVKSSASDVTGPVSLVP